jgi:hypothetical protein
MRRSALLLPFLAGCNPGYLVKLDVTVPVEVQAALSSTQPGMVMSKRTAVAVLCDPTSEPFTVQFSRRIPNYPCSSRLGGGWEAMYVYQPSQDDLDWLNANQAPIHCGQTSAITDMPSLNAIDTRANDASWVTNQARTIATGSGGSCDAAGNFTGAVSLKLVK